MLPACSAIESFLNIKITGAISSKTREIKKDTPALSLNRITAIIQMIINDTPRERRILKYGSLERKLVKRPMTKMNNNWGSCKRKYVLDFEYSVFPTKSIFILNLEII